jgi:hypothetical protein
MNLNYNINLPHLKLNHQHPMLKPSLPLHQPGPSIAILTSSLTEDLKQLLKMIAAYAPENIELETKLHPFVPEYIPCIGDIDPMLKVFFH